MADPIAPEPKQLRILKKLCAHLAQTPGYEGIKVHRGKSIITAGEANDTLSILEAPRPIIGSPAGEAGLRRLESWTLLVQGWPVDDRENPSDPAYYMKAAVERWLTLIVAESPNGVQRKDDLYRLGGDIASMIIGQGVVRPPEDASSRLAMFYLPLILEVTTNVSDPYA